MKRYIRIVLLLLCLCITACAFVSCGDTEDPVDIDMANSVKYEKMSFRYEDVESGEMKYIYPANREEFLAMRDIIIANKPTKETVSDSGSFMGSYLAIGIYFKEGVYAKTEMKKYAFDCDSQRYDKNKGNLGAYIESFNYEILEEISKNEKLEKIEIEYSIMLASPT